MKKVFVFILPVAALAACGQDLGENTPNDERTKDLVSLQDVAKILSMADLDVERMQEVHDAVSSSLSNGYDEEYTMRKLLLEPGSGVGEDVSANGSAGKGSVAYSRPMKEIFEEYYSSDTKGGGTITAEEYLNYIRDSDMQIYWPFSENWDGITPPTITFAPLGSAESNVGFRLDQNGAVEEVEVTEEYAGNHPVWVINRNDDAGYTTFEMYCRNNPDKWQNGVIDIRRDVGQSNVKSLISKADGDNAQDEISKGDNSQKVKTLVLKTFLAKRNYDNWFAGASEFFLKIGSVESFKANTEVDLMNYNPTVTDFMIVMRRKQVGQPMEMNTVLVSEWTSQLNNCALMLIEEDGGSINSWNCSATVKYNSKSYGFDISIPYKSHDDIVWRGQLGRKYIDRTSDIAGNFGDVQLTFSILEN